eukprot:TRINITY_DN8521_c0_g2_i1.p2 TRINITY_DN8521_c0_g2~~TRINITY_DN8521_c0_g2_i1.p2  ORF type:complete len:680 (+),score=173.95 TRINITY_DN8521_c0_g2_i1:2149-4188(+)
MAILWLFLSLTFNSIQSTEHSAQTLICYFSGDLSVTFLQRSLEQCLTASKTTDVLVQYDRETLHTMTSHLDVDRLAAQIKQASQGTSNADDLLSAAVLWPPTARVVAFVDHAFAETIDDQTIGDYRDGIPQTLCLAFVSDWSSSSLQGRLGALQADVAYEDGSEFHRALTLKVLIALGDEAANTLQAHLLSNGVAVRLMTLDRLSFMPASSWLPVEHTHIPVAKADSPSPYLMAPPEDTTDASCYGFHELSLERIWDWTDKQDFVSKVVTEGKVTLLRNTPVTAWPAMQRWANLSTFTSDLGNDPVTDVKLAGYGRFSDADMRSPLAEEHEWRATFDTFNTSAEQLLDITQQAVANRSKLVYFASLSERLRQQVQPDRIVYLTDEDWQYHRQFVWFSTNGSTTHTHFDQDYNIFIQVRGTKRFYFFPAASHRAQRMFPRVHPLWHKSKLDLCHPDLERYPEYASMQPVVVDIKAGEALYIPPYTWHRVVTTSDVSISLSTLSHDDNLRDAMTSIYKMDHKFDRLASPEGQRYAFRLYMDLLLNEMIGYKQTHAYIDNLLWERYQGIEHLFADVTPLCDGAVIPTAQHVYGDCVTDMRLVTSGFEQIAAVEVRDLLLADYIEELAAQIVGAKHVYAFFKSCFQGQEYEVTELGTPEHDLWEYKMSDDDNDTDGDGIGLKV